MTEDIKRVIVTDDTIKYEYITYTSSGQTHVKTLSDKITESVKF